MNVLLRAKLIELLVPTLPRSNISIVKSQPYRRTAEQALRAPLGAIGRKQAQVSYYRLRQQKGCRSMTPLSQSSSDASPSGFIPALLREEASLSTIEQSTRSNTRTQAVQRNSAALPINLRGGLNRRTTNSMPCTMVQWIHLPAKR